MIKKYQYNEDLFEDTKMTFGEHLEELRTCLWKAMLGLAIGMGIGLYFANRRSRLHPDAVDRSSRRSITTSGRTKS